MRLLALYLRCSPRAMSVAVALGAVSGLSAAALLALINHSLESGDRSGAVVAGFAGLCLVRLLSGVASHVLLVRLSQRAIFDMRMDLCDRILSSPLTRLERIGPHRLTACFTDDVTNIANVVVNIPYFLVNVVVLIGCLAYLGLMSGPVLIGVLACFMMGIATYLGPVVWANRQLRVAREHQDRLFRHFGSVVHGAKELKLHDGRREDLLGRVLRDAADAVRRHSERGVTIYATAANWNRLLFFVYVGLLLFLLPSAAEVTPAALAGYLLVLLYMMAPLEAIMNTSPHLAKADVSLQKIRNLGLSLTAEGQEPRPEATDVAHERWLELRLRGVTHRYGADDGEAGFRLGPIDLSFRRGEVVYLTGGNGSGKTTLVKLLTGLYAPDEGRVELDGRAITEGLRPAYRQFFSAVFSDCHLFEELLGIGGRDVDERARHHLRTLRLERKLDVDGGRFSTIDLSHGQRKRLALLTAILEDRPFYVLDEWAADQDPGFREMFYTRIVPELRDRGKTVLVVTHDDRYFHLADRRVRLDSGRVVEEGGDEACEAGSKATCIA